MLTAAAISETSIESATLAILEEWLRGYFTGDAHAVGGNNLVPFPKASLRFQQSAAPQPLDGTVITCVWSQPGRAERRWDAVAPDFDAQETMHAEVEWLFFVRAQGKTTPLGGPKRQCERVAELLYALLQNSKETLELAEKGIHRVRPVPPRLVSEGSGSKSADLSYAVRLVQCRARLRYCVLSQVVVTTTL